MAKLQRHNETRKIVDDTFGGKLYAAVTGSGGASHSESNGNTQDWTKLTYWALLENGEYRRGSLTDVDTRNRCFVFSDYEERRDVRVAPASVFPVNPVTLDSADDLTALTHLHDAAVLHHLKQRYANHTIYSLSGPILIALNPYQRVDSVYAPELLQRLITGNTEGDASAPRIPHVYAIGEQAYRAMRAFGQNQSILVTGESGAGKTETTKILLQYFAQKGSHGNSTDAAHSIEKRVLGTTPILESFGNAKTLRNDNSSRFGKFILVDFDEVGTVAGAQLRTYLLEKSRLTHQSVGERSYHIFYQLLAFYQEEPTALPSSGAWSLLEPRDYYYLNTNATGKGLTMDGVDDAAHFRVTLEALATIGIDINKVDRICSILVALLALGNIRFIDGEHEEANLVVDTRDWAGEAGILLGIPGKELLHYIMTRRISAARGERIIKYVSAAEATTARDSLAVFLYESLFMWLVECINDAVRPTPKMMSPRGSAPSVTSPRPLSVAGARGSISLHRARGSSAVARAPPPQSFIGILDIYGFETFETNSFEQFCINYANEKLQHQFNQHLFKLEQEEYVQEGIDWRQVDFSDNSGCIHYIENQFGVIDILNEETKLNQDADSFVHKLNSKPARASYVADSKNKPKAQFGIRHYPGPVVYDASGFIDKNRNASPLDFLALVFDEKGKERYGNELLAAICAPHKEARMEAAASNGAPSSNKKVTVVTQFKDSLAELMATISTTQPNYIRCIKPNDSKQPFAFEPKRVMEQLRCGGVMEAIRIAQAGFPTRSLYRPFGMRYAIFSDIHARASLLTVLDPTWHGNADDPHTSGRIAVEAILKNAACLAELKELPSLVHYGRTKIFLKAGAIGRLEDALTALQRRSATTLQAHIRRRLARSRFHALKRERRAVVLVQSLIRGHLLRERFLAQKKCSIAVQALGRARHARLEYQRKREEARELAAMAARIQASEKRPEVLIEQVSASAEAINALTAENQRLRIATAPSVVTQDSTELEARILEFQEQITEEQRKYKHMEEHLGFVLRNETERASKEAKRADAAEAHEDEYIATIEKNLTDRDALEKNLEATEREVEAAEKRAADAEERVKQRDAQVHHLKVHTDELLLQIGKVGTQAAHMEELTKRLAASESQRNELAALLVKAESNANELRAALEQRDMEYGALSTERDQLLDQMEELTTELDVDTKAQEELDLLRDDFNQLRIQLEATQTTLDAQVAKAQKEGRTEVDRLTREHDKNLECLREEYDREIEKVRVELSAEFEKVIKAREPEVLRETERAEEALARVLVLENLKGEAERQLGTLTPRLDAADEKAQTFEERCMALTKALEESRAAAASSAERVRMLQIELEEERRKNREATTQLKLDMDELHRSQNEFSAKMTSALTEVKAQQLHTTSVSSPGNTGNGSRPQTPRDQGTPQTPRKGDKNGSPTLSLMQPLSGEEVAFSGVIQRFFESRYKREKRRKFVEFFLKREQEGATSTEATPLAAIILGRWLLPQIRQWQSSTELLNVPRMLLDALKMPDATPQRRVWVFKTAAALYNMVRVAWPNGSLPPSLDMQMHWPPNTTKKNGAGTETLNSVPAPAVTILPPHLRALTVSLATDLQLALVTAVAHLIWPVAIMARRLLRRYAHKLAVDAPCAPQDMLRAVETFMTPFEALVLLLQQSGVLDAVLYAVIDIYFAVCDVTLFNALARCRKPDFAPHTKDAIENLVHLLNQATVRFCEFSSRANLHLDVSDVTPLQLFRYTSQFVDVLRLPKDALLAPEMRADTAPDLEPHQLFYVCALCHECAEALAPCDTETLDALHEELGTMPAGTEVVLDDVMFAFPTEQVHVMDEFVPSRAVVLSDMIVALTLALDS